MLLPAESARQLLKEAQDTHPWLHHPLFHWIWDGCDNVVTACRRCRHFV